jgi:hypothetical protein
MQEWQSFINIAAAAFVAVIGWFARVLFDSVNKLQQQIHELEVTLPSSYVRKDEFFDAVRLINEKLDRIYDKLESKVDKADR